MTETFALAALWLALAVVSTIIANHLKMSMALVEICVGIAVGFAADRFFGPDALGANVDWLRFLAASGAVLLTFLAGAELEPTVLRAKWKEVTVVGLFSFAAPFLGCAAVAYYLLGWDSQASWLAGVALSTTSMAVVYAVMLETRFNRTEYGMGILGACFVTDLGTVIALGLIFAPFTYKTVIFVVASAAVIGMLPFLTRLISRRYAHRTAAIRAKWVLLVLFGLGALALWSGSEAVLPAYIAGMVLAGMASEDRLWVRRMRTLTIGFLTPFYFIRAGSLVSLPAVVTGPLVFFLLLGGKVGEQNFWVVSGDQSVPQRTQRALVLHAADVDRPHLRDHFGHLWLVPRDRVAGAILVSRRRGDRLRRCPHRDRHHGVRAPAPDAAAGRSPNAPTGRGLRPRPSNQRGRERIGR